MSPLLQILLNLSRTFERLLPSFQSKQDFEALLFRYGWLVELKDVKALESVTTILDLIDAFVAFNKELSKLLNEEEDKKSESNSEEDKKKKDKDWKKRLKDLYALAKNFYNLILKLKKLGEGDLKNLGVFDDPQARAAFAEEFPERLIEEIFVLTLQRDYSLAYGFLHFFGIIEYLEKEPPEPYRVNYTQTNIDWGRLADFINPGPVQLFKDVYQWGDSKGYDWEKLLHTLERSFLANRFLVRYILPRKSVVENTVPAGLNFEQYEEYVFAKELHELQIPFIYGTSILDESFYNIGLGLMPLRRDIQKDGQGVFKDPDGLLITPILQGGLEHSFFITPEIALSLSAGLQADGVLAIKLFPDEAQLTSSAPDLDLRLGLSGQPNQPWLIVGSRDSHRLELSGFELGFSVEGSLEDPEIKLSFRTLSASPEGRGVYAALDFSESDSFIREAATDDKLEAAFDLEIEWSSKTGFRFGGDAALNLQLTLNKKVGPIEITNFYLSLTGENHSATRQKAIRFKTGLGLIGTLGPIEFFIENTGFALDLIPHETASLAPAPDNVAPDKLKNPTLGNMDLEVGFAPPDGIGLRIDAGPIKGGGYLQVRNGRYLGAAELTFNDSFTLKAVAIIDTNLPKGGPAYSFLLLITAEFNPIQLGFGFTLEGVGGLIGIHRGLNGKAIEEKVKTNAFDKILFPEDPLGELPTIVAALGDVFPVTQGQYSFGIMGKIGWGSIIDIKAGLLFQAPDFKIALVGTAKTEITRSGSTLIRIQIAFSAQFDPQVPEFIFRASLHNSEILGLPLSGDVAIYLRGGSSPYFLISLGGFHDKYKPPKNIQLPDMKRIALALDPDLEGLSVSAEFFCALTSNTVQFGFDARAEASLLGLGFEGRVGFDALFQFQPIYFIARVWGGVTFFIFGASFGGIEVRGEVEGPYPFIFNLRVSIPFLWWHVTVSVPEFKIGSKATERLPTVDVLAELKTALEDARNWKPLLPNRTHLLVSLRSDVEEVPDKQEQKEKPLFFHPVGGIAIDQSVVPLTFTLERFGHHEPADHNTFSIYGQSPDGRTVPTKQLKQFFAPAQYFVLEEKDKFERADYEKMPSGVEFNNFEDIQIGKVMEKEVYYETRIYDPAREKEVKKVAAEKIDDRLFGLLTQNGSTANSQLGEQQKNRRDIQKNVRLESQQFVLADQNDLTPFEDVLTGSEAEAEAILREKIKENPELAGRLQVVPLYETI